MGNSEIIYCRTTNDGELQEILRLQQKNLFNTLSINEKKQEGFVTISHSFALLKEMSAVCPHILAKANGKVIGYILCMHPRFAGEILMLEPMFKEIEKVLPNHTKYMVMGQICIDKAYRNKGIFRKLYLKMTQALGAEFDAIVTEVDTKNQRSLKAHYAIGFEHLKTHKSKGRNWAMIILK